VKISAAPLSGVIVFDAPRFDDERGWFRELWNVERYAVAELGATFAQTNVSHSHRGVLRGLHFQFPRAQGKLVTALAGEVFDIAVDLRPESSTFGRWYGCTLSADNRRQLWIPEGFAHGFLSLCDGTLVHYACTVPYDATQDRALAWDDPELAIDWPIAPSMISAKDRSAPRLSELRSLLAPGAAR
jgi:dTDP-4-dehydrorhamnose 3,5-epimerase